MFANIKNWPALTPQERSAVLTRPAVAVGEDVTREAARIISTVRKRGDAALFDYAAQFERRQLESLRVSPAEFRRAQDEVTPEVDTAIDVAIRNVRRFHEAQRPAEIDMLISPGVRCERRNHAIDAVGLYVPAGTAALPSTAIMLAVPASIAGCPVRILCSPADSDGYINAATLIAAERSGVTDVFKVGGAQAIAAMAFGTESVPRVNRIFGPGNAWVTAAKTLVAGDPDGASIDMPAGPSEVLVIADDHADPIIVAADLLSQAEHGEDSQVLLITTSRRIADSVIREVGRQLPELARQTIAQKAMCNSHVILTPDLDGAVDISNCYAPEHLILMVDRPREVLVQVRNAGAVFLGRYTPESAGDYCSGANHVLPTYGAACSYSGLGVEQFMRQMTVQELTLDGLRSLAPTVVELANLEGLGAHAEAVLCRLQEASAP